MAKLELSAEQKRAVGGVLDWYKSRSAHPFTIAGYAGTGKTTVLGEIVDRLPCNDIMLCAPTGKAAAVIRERMQGRDFVQVGTVHQFMYYPPKEGDGGELLFKKRKSIEADLVIVDEASMLSRQTLQDITGFGVPVLLVGDSFQLPPVNGDRISQLDSPDAQLTHVFRQALDNPVIRLATHVRLEGRLPADGFRKSDSGACGVFSCRDSRGASMALKFHAAANRDDTTLLCHTNRTRQRLNMKIRDRLGFGGYLMPDEKIVVLRNVHSSELYNGSVYRVESAVCGGKPNMLLVHLKGYESQFVLDANILGAERPGKVPDFIVPAHYGYALSVHKAQGSEWTNVALYDEHPLNDDRGEYPHWVYTGITRARKNLLVLRRG